MKLPKTFHTLRYEPGRIWIDGGNSYQVGPLTPDWRPLPVKTPSIDFYYKPGGSGSGESARGTVKATISTEAFCGTQFEDLPLRRLTENLLSELESVVLLRQTLFSLGQREALRTELTAKVDGVAVAVEAVVVKKNSCHFDFVLIGSLGQLSPVRGTFEQFYKGFDY